jgi:hypothetical protein
MRMVKSVNETRASGENFLQSVAKIPQIVASPFFDIHQSQRLVRRAQEG